MAIPPEQVESIKEQLLKQVEHLPQENREQIKEHIQKLNPQELEEFLKQNNIQTSENGLQQSERPQGEQPSKNQSPKEQTAPGTNQQASEKPIFQSIIDGEMPSYKIAENTKAIGILELNPMSKGHSIVLPKKQVPIEKLPKSSLTLAQKIAKKIKTKLKPDDIKIETASFQNYPMINIIPIYKDIQLKKEKATEAQLKKLQSQLETKKRASRKKKTPANQTPTNNQQPKKSNLPQLSFRIPR